MIECSQNNVAGQPLLPDYPYSPNFATIDNLKVHFLDEGERKAPAVLFLHGVPTWSYTFRKVVPLCLDHGCRVIAPDLPGFGKSDKPAETRFYSIANLVKFMGKFIQQQNLTDLFLFAHDWGAIVGMILAVEHPGRFAGIMVSNGYLPDLNVKAPFPFRAWQMFCKYSPILPIGRIVDMASKRKLSAGERKAYNFPFLSNRDKRAVRILPQLIPAGENADDVQLVRQSWQKLEEWEKPFLTIFSNADKISKGGEKMLQKRIPGAKKQAHKILNGKHFIQEDAPLELGLIIGEFVKNNK